MNKIVEFRKWIENGSKNLICMNIYRIGNNVQLHLNKHCGKCVVVNVDPDTGEVDPKGEPLKTLTKFRKYDYGPDPAKAKERQKRVRGPPLGINCGADRLGFVQVGDPVFCQIN